MAYKVGLEVVEGTTKGFTAIVEPSKRNIGVLMARKRGLVGIPALISGLEEDRLLFGNFLGNAYGYAVMKNFFRNSAGYTPTVYGVRIAGDGCSAAVATLEAGEISLDLFAAYENSEDVGDWGNDLSAILYPKGSRAAGRWYLEILMNGEVIGEPIVADKFSKIVDALRISKYIGTESVGSDFATEPVLNAPFTGLVKVGVAGGQADNKTFLLANTPVNFVTPAGFILLDESGNKIGVVATFDSATKIGTLEDIAIVNGNLTGASFLTDAAYVATFSGGVYVAPVETDFYGRTTDEGDFGLNIIKGEDVQVIMNTEFHSLTMAVEGFAFAAETGKFYVANLPEDAKVSDAQQFANALQTAGTSYGAVYDGWAETIVDDTNLGFVPVLGCLLGAAYVRAVAIQGDYIHIPPAGTDAAFVDILSVKGGKKSQAEIDRYVQDFTINVVQFQKGLGYFPISSRTMSSNALYHSIHIRLQTSFYRRVLQDNFKWVLQKPNTPELKREIYASAFAYFKIEYNNGALERSVPYKEACVIIIDQRNNPVGQNRKLLNLDIDWIPTEVTEAFRISLNRNDGQLLTNESLAN